MNTRRHVDLRAEVDGHEVGALGVMSQGELHALALALFLPRATMPKSPFRFVMLDDPVQAMDPTKIDGFVRVLERLARTRQVIVFSHDDRLRTAVDQLRVDATVFEVVRAARSVVTVRESSDPTTRYLDDASSFAMDRNVPEEVRRQVLPGLYRMAVEGAAYDLYLTRQIKKGVARPAAEDAWAAAERTSARIALALHGDRHASLDTWLSASWRRHALGICGPGAHNGLQSEFDRALGDVKRTVRDLRAERR